MLGQILGSLANLLNTAGSAKVEPGYQVLNTRTSIQTTTEGLDPDSESKTKSNPLIPILKLLMQKKHCCYLSNC